MSWFEKLMPSRIRTEVASKKGVPEGLWTKCPSCEAVLYRNELERNGDVCPKCDHHMRINARRRLDLFLDAEGRVEIAENLESADPLKFKDSKKISRPCGFSTKSDGRKRCLNRDARHLTQQSCCGCSFRILFHGWFDGLCGW